MAIDATVGGAAANSYETVAEADAYFASRLPLNPPWDDADSKEALLIMATRLLDAMFRGTKTLVAQCGQCDAFYRIGRKWTGAPATTTQRLAWPRTGMYDQNGNAIPSNVIPQDLKDAESELAGQLNVSDRTLDNDVSVQGITSVKAGSVAVTFRDGYIATFTLPQAVIDLLIASWYTEETIESAVNTFDFEVMTPWP